MPVVLDEITQIDTRRTAESAAFRYEGKTLTRQRLASAVERLGATFRQHFMPGDLCVLWLPNCPEALLCHLSSFQSGVIPMPLHVGSTLPEVTAILARSGCRHLVVSSAMAARLHAADFAGTPLQHAWVISEEDLAPLFSLDTVDSDSGTHQRERLLAHQAALVMHTSGSSGEPKAAVLSRSALQHIIQGHIDVTGLAPDCTGVIPSCLSHSVGLHIALSFLASGAEFELLPDYEIERMAAAFNRVRPTHFALVPSAIESLLAHDAIDRGSFLNLRFGVVGADRVTPQLQEAFIALTGRPLAVSYGLTELSWLMVNDSGIIEKCTALGRESPGVEVRLLDRQGNEAGPGETGEIVARCPKAMCGYLEDLDNWPETNLVWLRTGDLAHRDEDGDYWFDGRAKDLIVLNSGDLVSPVEVETSTMTIPGISHCVVVGMPRHNRRLGSISEEPWAIVRNPDPSISEQAILAALGRQLSAYKLPRKIVFLREFPKGSSGKVSRRELREWLLETHIFSLPDAS